MPSIAVVEEKKVKVVLIRKEHALQRKYRLKRFDTWSYHALDNWGKRKVSSPPQVLRHSLLELSALAAACSGPDVVARGCTV